MFRARFTVVSALSLTLRRVCLFVMMSALEVSGWSRHRASLELKDAGFGVGNRADIKSGFFELLTIETAFSFSLSFGDSGLRNM
jgi:hypothetical protein